MSSSTMPDLDLRRSEQFRCHRATPGRQPPRRVQRNARFLAPAETLQRGHRQQPVFGGARPLAGRARLLHFEGGRVQHDAVTEGAVGGSRRDGPCCLPGSRRHRHDPRLEIPKVSPDSVAVGIFDGLEKGEEDIFPDTASQSMGYGWRTGVAKALERQYAAFVQESAANLV